MTGNHHLDFFIMLISAALAGRIPVIGYPLRWAEVFFHEFSHGLMTLLTFGRPGRLKMTWHGGGSVTTYGGWRLPVLLAGYCGAVLWGVFIYLAGLWLDAGGAEGMLLFLTCTVIFSIILQVRDPITLMIMLALLALFAVPLKYPELFGFSFVLQFVGMGVALSALHAPFDMIDGKHTGDGAELADVTFIPEGVWILFWLVFGLTGLAYMWQAPLPATERWLTFLPFLS